MTDPARTLTGGVDTHKDTHVAAALDELGRVLGTESFPATAAGYQRLLAWLGCFGEITAVGIEGTGTWGAGLARALTALGVWVLEVQRPNRQHRRRHGKSDPADALSAARTVQAGEANGTPKATTGRHAPPLGFSDDGSGVGAELPGGGAARSLQPSGIGPA
jgi:transposase